MTKSSGISNVQILFLSIYNFFFDLFCSCLNVNTYTTKIIGIPPRDPLTDYGVQYMGDVAYLDVAVTKEEKWMLHEAVTTGLCTGSHDGTNANFNILYSSYTNNNQSELVMQVISIYFRLLENIALFFRALSRKNIS